MMLLVSEAGSWESIPEAKQKEIFGRIGEWWGELSGKGKIVDGYQLQPVHTATTVKLNGGKPVVTDGPFAEAKETIGGYGVLNVANLDEAIGIAKSWPGGGIVEPGSEGGAGRPAAADLHLLPPRAQPRGAGRAHPAGGDRADDAGDRPRLSDQ